ncbi:MAG: cupin domain-containing protein [Chthoniobacteraceae bacterium]
MSKSLDHPFIIKNIFNLAERQDELEWEHFRKDVDIHWIYQDGETGPAAALMRFQPGGRVSLHHHEGFEHIIVLSGSQTDENGHLEAGSLMVHTPGTSHSIYSEEGCLVLAIYEKRVSFGERQT